MNKVQLVDATPPKGPLTKADPKKPVRAKKGSVKGALKKKKSVSLVGSGTAKAAKRATGAGQESRTGAALKTRITSSRIPK